MNFDSSKKGSINENQTNSKEEKKDEVICKDGFCFLPNIENKQIINNQNINIFDPI